MSPVGKINGRVLVTNYRLRFEAKASTENRHTKVREEFLYTVISKFCNINDPQSDTILQCCRFDIPLGCISKVEKVGYSTVSRGEDSYGLEITCKVSSPFCDRVVP